MYKNQKVMHFRPIYFLFFLWCTISYQALSQTPVGHFSFDGCALSDKMGHYSNVIPSGSPGCDCAPVHEGLGPAQTGDILDFDPTIGQVLSGDFTLSFYIKMLNKSGSGIVDILSNASTCLQDSTFTIQFDQLSQEIILSLVINPTNKIVVKARLDPNQCWHYIALTRDNVTFTLYVDGQRADRFVYERGLVIPVRTDNPFRMGTSVCNAGRFVGFIDEFKLYTSALHINDISGSFLPVNRILTPDTFLLRGDALVPLTLSRCASQIQWSPATGVSDPNIIDPDLAPDQTTQYVLESQEGDCTSYDTLRIQVIDPEDVKCQNLYLPSAFTPNGDNINDDFGISNFYIIETLEYFDIFDKWGGVVFHTNNKNAKWDGYYKGKALNPGVYSYKISYACHGKNYLKTGAFNILR